MLYTDFMVYQYSDLPLCHWQGCAGVNLPSRLVEPPTWLAHVPDGSDACRHWAAYLVFAECDKRSNACSVCDDYESWRFPGVLPSHDDCCSTASSALLDLY